MRGIPIKFRGVRIDGNGYAYGDLEHRNNGREIWIGGWQVRADSVAQLAYLTCYNCEVYDDYWEIDSAGKKLKLEMVPCMINDATGKVEEIFGE